MFIPHATVYFTDGKAKHKTQARRPAKPLDFNQNIQVSVEGFMRL